MKQKLNTSCHSPTGPNEQCKGLLPSRCAHSYNRSKEGLRPQVGQGQVQEEGPPPQVPDLHPYSYHSDGGRLHLYTMCH